MQPIKLSPSIRVGPEGLLITSGYRRLVARCSNRDSLPHTPLARDASSETSTTLAQAKILPSTPFNNWGTESSVIRNIPQETSLGSLINTRRKKVVNAEPSANDKVTRSKTSTTIGDLITTMPASNFNAATSSSPRSSPAAPSTKQMIYQSKPTIPVGTNADELLPEALLPSMPKALVSQMPYSFNVRRKPPPLHQDLAKTSPASITQGQSSSGGSSSPHTASTSQLPLRASSMRRKVQAVPGDERFPHSAPQLRRVGSSSSDNTTGAIRQSSSHSSPAPGSPSPGSPSPGSPSPPPTSRKRLLTKRKSSSHPNNRSNNRLVSGVAEGSSEGKDASGSVVPSDPAAGSTLLSDAPPPSRAPDFHVTPFISTTGTNIGNVYSTGGEKGSCHTLEKFWNHSKVDIIKENGTDTKPARQRNVLRKRSLRRLADSAQTATTLDRTVSPSHPHEYEEHARHGTRPHDNDRIPNNQAESTTFSKFRILCPRPGLSDVLTTPSHPLGKKHIGLFPSEDERVVQQDLSSESYRGSRNRRQKHANTMESLSPAALIAVEYNAISEVSRNRDEGYISPKPRRKTERADYNGMSTKDRYLSRSASMTEIRRFGLRSVDNQQANAETMPHRRRVASQSLTLPISKFPDELHKDNKAGGGGGILGKLMRKFSTREKRGGRPPAPLPIWSISTPVASPPAVTTVVGDQSSSRRRKRAETLNQTSAPIFSTAFAQISPPKSSPADEIPPLPKRPVHIVNPSVLDQAYQEDEITSEMDRSQFILPTFAFPEVEWTRIDSPEPLLSALSLPPRRPPKSSNRPPSQLLRSEDLDVTHSGSPITPVESTFKSFQRGESSRTRRSTFSPISDFRNLHRSHSGTKTSSTTNSADLQRDTTISTSSRSIPSPSFSPPPRPRNSSSNIAQPMPSAKKSSSQDLRAAPVRDEEADPKPYSTFTRSSLTVTPSVVWRPGTANTFGGSEILGSNVRSGTRDSAMSKLTERGRVYSFAGSSLSRNSSSASTRT